MGPEAEKHLKRIMRRDLAKYGPICKNEFCGMYQKFCRCKSYEEYKKRKNL